LVKVYEIEYEINIAEKLRARRNEIVKEVGRFWEHAIARPVFKYELREGDLKKAKAIARILKLLNGKVKFIKKKQIVKEVI